MKHPLSALICIIIGFACTCCTYDDLQWKDESPPPQRTQKEQTAYDIAIAKLPSLYLASGKKRMSKSLPVITSAQALWYGDTAIINPTPDPGFNDKPDDDDKIYAYLFNFDNNEGSMVIGVDSLLPDMIMFTVGRNFMEKPFLRTPTVFDEFLVQSLHVYAQREKFIREMLAYFSNICAESTQRFIEDQHKLYDPVYFEGEGDFPRKLKPDTIWEWHETRPQMYKDGRVPVQFLNIYPYTSEIEEVYGKNANCWDLIPTVMNYLACLQKPFEYNGWSMSWADIITNNDDLLTEELSEQIRKKIAHMYYLLGLPDNLDVNYQSSMPMSAIHNIPRTLLHFGINPGGTVYEDGDLFLIINELNNGYPAIGIMEDARSKETNLMGIHSFIADDYYIMEQNEIDHYTNKQDFERTYRMYHVALKFSDLTSGVKVYGYYDWSIFDPNVSRFIQSTYNPYMPPSMNMTANKCYKNLYVIGDIGENAKK